MEDPNRQKYIWLEVANVRRLNNDVQIQVKGDRADHEPVWWNVKLPISGFEDAEKAYRAVTENLDKKRIVLANLIPDTAPEPVGTTLKCTSIRIQYAESSSR